MAIIETITDDYHFWTWLKQSGSYQNNFSLEGAKAVQAWYEEYSDSTGEDVEFDPIAWCVEFTEYDSVAEAYREQYGDDSDLPEEQRRTTKEQQLEFLEDNTTVIELDNDHIILMDF